MLSPPTVTDKKSRNIRLQKYVRQLFNKKTLLFVMSFFPLNFEMRLTFVDFFQRVFYCISSLI